MTHDWRRRLQSAHPRLDDIRLVAKIAHLLLELLQAALALPCMRAGHFELPNDKEI